VTLLLELSGIRKDYRGLRPLRVDHLAVSAGEQVAMTGIDQPAAEVLVNLVTGAALPDAGEVRVFGQPTAAIGDSHEWLAIVDRFGIVSDRSVLLEGMTVVQNLSMPFTLDIEPPPDSIRERASALAGEVALPPSVWEARVGDLDGADRLRVRVARAIALDPAIVLLEHATAAVARNRAAALGTQIRRVAAARGAAVLALTADREFASAVAGRVLALEPATGRLVERRRWFR
jgi:ABC-type transporter Mla maintaining outer membrane lipid asymmetry ATPase subunit MlaF